MNFFWVFLGGDFYIKCQRFFLTYLPPVINFPSLTFQADNASVHADDPIHIINVCIKDPETTIEQQEDEKMRLQKVILEKVRDY